MLDDSDISLLRPPVLTIRNAQPRDLPELNDMIRLLAAHHGDPSGTTPDQGVYRFFSCCPASPATKNDQLCLRPFESVSEWIIWRSVIAASLCWLLVE